MTIDPQYVFQEAAACSELEQAARAYREAGTRLNNLLAQSGILDRAGTSLSDVMRNIQDGMGEGEKAEETILPAHICYNLSLVDDWLSNLHDPEMPDAGRLLQKRIKQANFKIVHDLQLESMAGYCSYSLLDNKPRFAHTVTIGKKAASDKFAFFAALVHEPIHALQKKECAALHASPFNGRPITIKTTGEDGIEREEEVFIVICPSDWVLLQERCEQDAYTKEAWMNSLLAQHQHEVLKASELSALRVRTFNEYRQWSGGNLKATLQLAAENALHRSFFSDNEACPYRFVSHYQDHSLDGYVAAMKQRREMGQNRFIFVRVSPKDIYDIGKSFGPNPFGDDPANPALLNRTPMLSFLVKGRSYETSTWDRYQALKADLGIEDESKLPFFRDFLTQHNITLEQFMSQAMGSPVGVQSLSTPSPAVPSP